MRYIGGVILPQIELNLFRSGWSSSEEDDDYPIATAAYDYNNQGAEDVLRWIEKEQQFYT